MKTKKTRTLGAMAGNGTIEQIRLNHCAPELLEVLKGYLRQHEEHRYEMPEVNENDGKVWERLHRMAMEAIARAEGRAE